MDEKEFERRLAAGIGNSQLWRLRRNTATAIGRVFRAVGIMLNATTDPTKPKNPQIIAFSILLQMAGELTRASAQMLASGQHYAGAALLRQIVEIEYLTWTFKEGHRDPEKWLNATHRQRMQDFTPAQLRQTSHGRFLAKDYQHHCEQGGHPVPLGAHLLSTESNGAAQLLLADLIAHAWRTWDHVQKWATGLPSVWPIIDAANTRVFPVLMKWGDADPLYKAMVEQYPNPDVRP